MSALDSVGKNLFGDAVFSATPSDPIRSATPSDPIRLSIASDTRLSTTFNVFAPPDPTSPRDGCRSIAQLSVTPPSVLGGGPPIIRFHYNASLLNVQFDSEIPPNPVRPNVARCAAAAVN